MTSLVEKVGDVLRDGMAGLDVVDDTASAAIQVVLREMMGKVWDDVSIREFAKHHNIDLT